MMHQRLMSLREFAKTLHVTKRAIRKAIETGRLQQGVERVNVQPVIRDPALAAEWARNRDRGRDSSDQGTIATARRRVLEAQAVNVELANALKRGEVVEVAEVREAWTRLVLACRESFLSLGAIAVQKGFVRREDEAPFQGWIDSLLEQLSRGGRPALAPRVPFPPRRNRAAPPTAEPPR